MNKPSHNIRRRFVIGDLQGCFNALKSLLKQIQFDASQDFIYFTGDLVARGENSLACLRFVKKLVEQGAAATVLGNHDLTLIACGRGLKAINAKDQTQEIFDALDGSDLINWLRHQPLLIEIDQHFVITHAGVPHIWTLAQAKGNAHAVEVVLQSDLQHLDQFLKQMYGSYPDTWSDTLTGYERLRVITNYFTRMRLTAADGRMNFKFKQGLQDPMPEGFLPWFSYPNKICQTHKILFGHWAALQAQAIDSQIIALDGGCVWGGELVAFELNEQKKYSVKNIAN